MDSATSAVSLITLPEDWLPTKLVAILQTIKENNPISFVKNIDEWDDAVISFWIPLC